MIWNLVSVIWTRNFLQFKKSLGVNLFWIVLEPLFYLIALGYGLGSLISSVEGGSYADFFFPALLCITTMLVPFFECTYGAYTKMSHTKLFRTFLLSPISPDEILAGEILWAATKGLISAVGVTLVAIFFGHIQSVMIFPAFIVLFLNSLFFASLGMIVTTYVKNYDGIIYPTSGIIMPMSLFSGTYFPVESLALWIQLPIYLLPLSHTVALVRDLMGSNWNYFMLLHLFVLITLVAGTYCWARSRFIKKMIQ